MVNESKLLASARWVESKNKIEFKQNSSYETRFTEVSVLIKRGALASSGGADI
jgi:hypothetical protein